MYKRSFRQEKRDEIEAQFISILRDYNKQGLGPEAMAATASALQSVVVNNGANNHLPHFQSADMLLRGVTRLFDNPLDEPYALDKIREGLKDAENEFALLKTTNSKSEEVPSRKRPKLEIIDGGLVPVFR